MGRGILRRLAPHGRRACPLFGVGTPELAGPELTARALGHAEAMGKPFLGVAERAAERLGVAIAP